MKSLSIWSPRQKRAIQALCCEEAIPSFDLAKIVGTTNIAEVILQLRRRGWEIETTRFELVDQDGCICRPGKYSLSEVCKKEGARLLTKNDTRAVAPAPVSAIVNDYKTEHSERGEL